MPIGTVDTVQNGKGKFMIQLNMSDSRAIYIQIVDGIKEQVVRGLLVSGDQIPSIRQLAAMLIVTPNTVSKAYQELERQGVIVSVRGKGNFINAGEDKKEITMAKEKIKEQLKPICVEWQYMKLEKEALKQMIECIFEELEGGV